MKQKYNWDKLKLEYFSIPTMEVKEFFQYTYSTYTCHIKQKTNGWREEKQNLIRSIKIEAQKEMEQELKELYKPTIEEMSQMHKAVITVVKWKLFNLAQNIKKDKFGNIILPDNLNMKEVEIMWKIVKQELEDIRKKESIKNNNYISKIVVV